MRLQVRTLRVRAVVVSVLIALSPLLFVWLGPSVEESTVSQMQGDLYRAANQMLASVDHHDGVATDRWARHHLDKIAAAHHVWLRVVSPDGTVLYSTDHGSNYSVSASFFERLLTWDAGPPKLAQYETTRPPLAERQEVHRAVAEGRSALCEYAFDGQLLTCVEVRRVGPPGADKPRLLYLRDGSVRRMRTIAGMRYPLLKLVFQVLGVSIVLGLWMGWWSVRPVKRLREQVAERARTPVSTELVDVDDRGEIGELADAFNALLEALEQRKQANQAFMADIAHEIKNPVAAVKAAAERLDSGEMSPERAERLGRILQDSSRRLDELVSRFLELARAEAGLPDEQRQPVALDALASALVDQFRADERYTALDFEADIAPATVDGAPGHLETALRNLLTNAASFAETTVRVSLRADDGRAVLTVADDGPGISADDLPHVFDRFFSRRHDQGGTGLGLSMTRAIVEAHRGRIHVDSTVGEGTRFTVEI